MFRSAHRIVGFLDEVTPSSVRGWCRDMGHSKPLEIQVKVNGVVRVSGRADIFREGIKLKGFHPTGRCAFELTVPGLEEGDIVSAWVPRSGIELTHSPKVLLTPRTICFIHIPKSGGTAINTHARSLFGRDQVSVHVENLKKEALADALQTKRVISGHVSYASLCRVVGAQPVSWVTVVREPFAQLISHVAWVRHLASEGRAQALDAHPDYIKKLAAKLATAELADPSAVRGVFQGLEPLERRLLDHCQVRYFSGIGTGARVEEGDAKSACETLNTFAVIGLTERMDESVRLMEAWFGIGGGSVVPENVSTCKYGLDENSTALREVLEPYCKFDVVLYRHAVELFERELQRVLGS